MFVINLRESTDLQFSVAIDGNVKKVDSVALCIEGLQYTLKLPCKYSGQTVTCEVPILESIIGHGDRTVYLELIIDGRVFRPFQDTITFEKPVEVKSTLTSSKMFESAPTISARPITKPVSRNVQYINSVINEAKSKLENASLIESVNLVGSVLQSLKKESNGPELAKKWITTVEEQGRSMTQISSSRDAWSLLDDLKTIIND